MQKTPDKIVKLVEDYESLASGRVPDSFDEAQLKATFIEPIFEELGWDIRNPSEVVREKRVHIRESTKSADYCFNISGKPQFILEAKDFRKKLNNKDYIFQTKLYGYNLPSPLGVLTNFGRFKLYDTGLEPDYDNPARGLVKKYDLTYTDYLEKWDLIYEMFSMSAVEGGSLVELIPKSRRVRNKEALDIKFFESLTEWRKKFAENIALRNKHLNDEYLINEAVQRILDRMVFIRVIEDRGIESVQLLRDALNRWDAEREKPLYRYVVDKFRYLDPHYNGQLFEKHPLSENLIIDDDLVRQFIESLYYPKSPYQFNKIGVEMLGTIYERFLGSTIRLTPSHRAKVEEKPEVRKARGVYYTPKYIVDYIVENTVGELLKKCKTPRAVANLKILDPACGSGSFLLGAFQRLIDWHEDYYNENPDKIRKGVGSALAGCWYDKETERWRMTAREKGKILVNNIHGVDIDPSAVEVTIMSLYLKVLEDTDTEFLIKTALLPPLHRNVKCGNSLIGSDYWDFIRDKQGELFERSLSDERRVNTFDWEDEFEEIMKPRPRHRRGAPQQAGPAPQQAGFDAVIGNPPYVLLQTLKSPIMQKYLNLNFEGAAYKIDTYQLFLEKGCRLTKENGFMAMITPNTFLRNKYARALRKFILDNTEPQEICLFYFKVFDRVSVDTAVISLRRAKNPNPKNCVKFKESKLSKSFKYLGETTQGEWANNHDLYFDLPISSIELSIIKKIDDLSVKLGTIANAYFGIQTYDRKMYVKKEQGGPKWKPALDGGNIRRYLLHEPREFVCVEKKAIKSGGKSNVYENKRVGVRQIGKRPIATILPKGWYSLNTVYNIYFNRETKYKYEFILGLISSNLIGWYWEQLYYDHKKTFPKIKKAPLLSIPVVSINFENPNDVKLHDRMVSLVEEMLSLHGRLADVKSDADRTRLERAIKKTDKKIDTLVYDLYELTDEEIVIVEEGQ